MKQVMQFFQSTGRRLRAFFNRFVSHFFRRGSVALRLAIKLPFLFEAEVTLSTDWGDRGKS